MTLVERALQYASYGWPVFPCEPSGKQPLGRLVPHGLKEATTDEKTIRKWWGSAPDANIGCPTGIIFDVADFDSEAAIARFAALCTEHGLDPRRLPRARTGGGGRHVLVAPTGIGNRLNIIPGLDWRGAGGYIVMPGSKHPSGADYAWVSEPNGSGFPTIPDWWMELLKPPVSPQIPSSAQGLPPEAYVKKAMEDEIATLRASREPGRNDALNRAAFALGRMVGAQWLTRMRATAELRAGAIAVGLVDPEVSATIKSGLNSGIAEPREAPAGGWGEPGGEIRGRDGAKTVRTNPAPNVYSAADLQNIEIADPRAVVPGIIFVGLNMLAGKGKLGKSWLALDVALGIASGGSVLGHQVPAGEVLYLALEDNQRRMKVRISKLWEHPKWPARLIISHNWLKLDEGGVQALESWLEEHSACSLVIIDVWKRLRHKRAKNANLYDEDYEHLVPLQAIAIRFDVAILVVHHTRKAAAEDVFDEISGSGGVLAALDSCIILHRARSEADGEIWITGRDLEEAHLALKFEDGHWSMLGSATEVSRSRERRDITDCITSMGRGVMPAEVALALGKPRNTINHLMWKMLLDGDLSRGPNTTYTLRVMGKESKEGNRGNEVRGDGITPLPPYPSTQGCPKCGQKAYSLRGDQRRCHKCGELYG